MIYEKPSRKPEDMSREDLLQLIQTSCVMSLPELLTVMYRAANNALCDIKSEERLGLNDMFQVMNKAAVAAFEAKSA